MVPIRALHTTASLHVDNGGPPRTICALASGLGRLGHEVAVLALSRGGETNTIQPDAAAATTIFVEPGRGAARRYRHAAESWQPHLVHDHGLWLPTNHAASRAAQASRVPLVVSVRGMLEPWARRHRRLKKAAAWWAYQRRDLAGAAMVHATAPSEASNLRAAGLTMPIVIVPNGVEVPAPTLPRPRSERRRALFLSRVHPIKGLPMLLDAWAAVAPEGWDLMIAGPDEGGHRAELEILAARLGLEGVSFFGAIHDDAKWDLYRSADLFVLPTYSENFGVVVAEALAAGVPVLTTTGAPWSELVSHRCGWWVEPEPRALREALGAALAAPDLQRAEMGARGRALIVEAYGWPGIAARMAEAYDWVLDRRPTPPFCVHVD